ncbi:MAG: hypothetical protein AB7E05_11150 [Sphingobium sp.]
MTTLAGIETQEEEDLCSLRSVRQIAALLDIDPATFREGQNLPNGWHFACFTWLDRQSDLGFDGLPPPPPVEGLDMMDARAMLGGRRLSFHRPIPIGACLRRRRAVAHIASKEGRSGPITIVTRRAEIFVGDDSDPAIVEEEDMIYRSAAATTPDATPKMAAQGASAEPASVSRPFCPDEIHLFRYSAIGFNPHRIHYDLPYARDVEGFPALVVNGGLTQLFLLELFRRTTGREAKTIAARNLAPLFCGEAVTLNGRETEAGWTMWASGPSGVRAAESILS